MKIAFLLGSLNRGGTETLLLDVFQNAGVCDLNAIGIYRKSGSMENDFRSSGVPMYFLPKGRNVFQYLLRLRSQIQREQVNIVHAQQPLDAIYAYLACMFTSCKVVLTFHGYDFGLSSFSSRILRFAIKTTHSNIYVSDTQRQYYIQKYQLNPSHQLLLYNGVMFGKFDQPSTNFSLKSELGLNVNTLLLGAVGNFVIGRDQLTLCRAADELNRLGVNFCLVFVGKRVEQYGHLYDDCVEFCEKNKLNDRIVFLGGRADVPQLLPRFDAFVYSTDHDTFGIAVVEAMAVGIPVFVNDWGVMNEITANGEYATIYQTRNAEDLAKKIMEYLNDKNPFEEKSKRAYQYVRNQYSIENHIRYLKKIYNSLT